MPNRDQRRRDGTFEYAQLDIAPAMRPQRQDSLTDQLRDLIRLATRDGMYDAADYLREVVERAEVRLGVPRCRHGSTEPHNYRRPASALLNVCPGPTDGNR